MSQKAKNQNTLDGFAGGTIKGYNLVIGCDTLGLIPDNTDKKKKKTARNVYNNEGFDPPKEVLRKGGLQPLGGEDPLKSEIPGFEA